MADIQRILMYFLWTKLHYKTILLFYKIVRPILRTAVCKMIRIALKKVMDPNMCIFNNF